MRILRGNRPVETPQDPAFKALLFKLLIEGEVLQGLVKRVTSQSLSLHLDGGNLELTEGDLAATDLASFSQGEFVELGLNREGRITLKTVPTPVKRGEPIQQALTPSSLEATLKDLNIPPTAEALKVAQALLERGFPLKEKLLWALMPWADEGQLADAFLLLQGEFPLRQQLIEVGQALKQRAVTEPLLTEAIRELPPELEEAFRKPSIDNRIRWSESFSDEEPFKVLVRLLAEERLLHAILGEHVFALPFLRKDDLYTAWLRIRREPSPKDEQSWSGTEPGFQIEVVIPTANLGVVRLELSIRGKAVVATFRVAGESSFFAGLVGGLEHELTSAGWLIQGLAVENWAEEEGWEYAKSSGFTLRPR